MCAKVVLIWEDPVASFSKPRPLAAKERKMRAFEMVSSAVLPHANAREASQPPACLADADGRFGSRLRRNSRLPPLDFDGE